MKKSWFYRLLFSYFPIFFVFSSVLILLAYLMLSEMSRRETIHANGTFVQHVIQLIDHKLREIDGMLIEEMETDERIRQYFHPRPTNEDGSHYTVYEISKKINQMVSFNTFIDSVYLYRYSDDMVMSANTLIKLDQFGDRAFIEESSESIQLFELSDKRTYREFRHQELFPSSVVSLVREYPMLEGGQGLVVVNISLAAVERLLTELSGGNISFVDIKDRQGNAITAGGQESELPGTVLSEFTSDYTGWSYKGGVRDIQLFRFASLLSYIWVAGGILTAIAGGIWLTYVTRRNYRPIEALMSRMNMYMNQRNNEPGPGGSDEFGFIEQALDKLVKESDTYQKMQQEDALFRRRHFFMDLLEGSRPITAEEWESELERFGMARDFHQLGVVVYEIDQYTQLTGQFSYRDFNLLKFVLGSVIQEVAEAYPVHIWTEWTEQHRLVALYRTLDDDGGWDDRLTEQAEQIRAWVENNVAYTVTVGVGEVQEQLGDISISYAQALHALAYKSSLGLNRVLRHDEHNGELAGSGKTGGVSSDPLRVIRELAAAFRTGESNWEIMYASLFEELGHNRLTREEYAQLFNMIAQQIQRELAALPEKALELWQADALPKLSRVRDTFDLAGDAQAEYKAVLAEFQNRLEEIRSSNSHHALIVQVKNYIGKEFANPDISLNHLCDEFGLNGKYLSRLFKETFGEKLVDHLVRVRIEESQRLLRTTGLSLQEIANTVGYVHDISFIRAFKKLVGTTPGEYRKHPS
ncbi:helix-turn-helix domain-containing protein [Paenibacillus agaridevorans]|uniref:helix-turn-helix domain-containing protein n=1 Tax=Paenibacillus agaridevorans TaxID=171404 RepID=UPI001BE413D7|nr:helix-turn-helix domain-containing protein [Paenibacillus agaridevorans]